LHRMAGLARALADLTSDPKQREELLRLAGELEKAAHELDHATHNALAHPDDKKAHEDFESALDHARATNADVIATAFPDGEEELRKGSQNIQAAMKRMIDKLKNGDQAGALAALDELEKLMKRQAALARALAIHTTDPAKRRMLLDAAMQLQNGLGNLLGPIRDSIVAGNLEEAMELMNRLLNDTFKAAKKLEDSLRSAAEEEEEPTDEIMKAAHHVQKVVKTKDIDESTPEGRIYLASKRIAEEMALMSDAAARGANSEVIVIARRIYNLVQDIFSNAQQVTSACPDRILKDQIMSVAQAVRNIAVQLKIITAVKAASPDQDTTIKAQLVKCAQSLASNVVCTCNAVEIATIAM